MFLVMWITICAVTSATVPSSNSAYAASSAYSPTYDLDEICSKQSAFHLELSPMHKALFQLNASLSAAGPKGIGIPTSKSSSSSQKPIVLSCFFTLRTKRPGANISLDLQWFNFHSDCHDYIQIKKPEEAIMVCLDGTSHQVLNLPNVGSIDLYMSVRRSSSPKHYLEIWASSSASASGSSQTDVSSIILAFMAPFAFILLAVIMAVMGSCCCSKKCRRSRGSEDSTTQGLSSLTTSGGSLTRPSGSRDTLIASSPLGDKPPAYEDLFPADFIYSEESKKAPAATPLTSSATLPVATDALTSAALLPVSTDAVTSAALPMATNATTSGEVTLNASGAEILANPANLESMHCAIDTAVFADETARNSIAL